MTTLHFVTDVLSDKSRVYSVRVHQKVGCEIDFDCFDESVAHDLLNDLHKALSKADQPVSIGKDISMTCGWTDNG